MSYENPRLKLESTMMDIIIAFSEGNPGAVDVLCKIVKHGAEIDPDSAFGAFGHLMHLDSLDCYGSRIWMLYKNVCKQNLNHMLALMRASQMGVTTNREINAAINGNDIDLAGIVATLKERLPNFVVEAPALTSGELQAKAGL